MSQIVHLNHVEFEFTWNQFCPLHKEHYHMNSPIDQ